MCTKLYAQLDQLGRMKWLENRSRNWLTPVLMPDPQTSWERVKGLQVLKPYQLAILREIAVARRTCFAKRHSTPLDFVG